jgi:hypothetical protein
LSASADAPAKPAIFCEGANYSEAFEQLWTNWIGLNRVVDKRGASQQWNTTLRSRLNGAKPEVSAERIVKAAVNFREAMKLEGRSPQFVMHASKFLGRDQLWLDYENWTPTEVPMRPSSGSASLSLQRSDGHDPAIYERRVRGPRIEPEGHNPVIYERWAAKGMPSQRQEGERDAPAA